VGAYWDVESDLVGFTFDLPINDSQNLSVNKRFLFPELKPWYFLCPGCYFRNPVQNFKLFLEFSAEFLKFCAIESLDLNLISQCQYGRKYLTLTTEETISAIRSLRRDPVAHH
tara:strand:- start:144 stop:482 length:339 start_codon:yes stop_codon:yes gene_type:complete